VRDRAPEIPAWPTPDGAVTQHLAAIRMLFDWLVSGRVIATNPTHLVRGPKNVVKTGKTTVLTGEQP
jgi:site-specific recombinase XerC